LSGWLKTARKKKIGTAILLLVAAIYFCRWEQSRDKIKLTVLPLNGGHSIFVDAAGRKNDWLVDCGNEDAVEFTLKPFLRAQGVNKIPRLILTEGDSKNCGGAQLLNDLFGIGELWTSGVKFRSSAYREAVSQFEKPPSRHNIFNYGDKIGCWQILSPSSTNNFPRADDNALVLRGNFSGTKILLFSDLSHAGQSTLLENTNNLSADIAVAGLPNDGEPLCDALLDAIQPKIIIIADSEFPASRRASRELRDRLAQKRVPVIYTRASGAVTIITDKRGCTVRTMDGQKIKIR
jgi:beta-lactamase superfamily II metal-dependent hydrolase